MTVDDNPLADFAFDKLPTELLVEIFKHARPDNPGDAYIEPYLYPVALAQVCHHWRSVALSEPTLWVNIRVSMYYTEDTRKATHVYLERSKACPLFLTWFSNHSVVTAEVREVINELIIPGAERWQRITLFADNGVIPDALLSAMGSLDFPALRDVEITSLTTQPPPRGPTVCRNAPLLRRLRLRNVPSLPPLPSNLVTLDLLFLLEGSRDINLDPILEFLPHVAHSLEHLRFGVPISEVSVTPVPLKSRTTLQNLRSLIVRDSGFILDHILVPNLTYFAVFHNLAPDARGVAKMFNGFSAPKLQSIRLYKTPLLPLLTSHNLPSMFPQLESVTLGDCVNEDAFASLLGPPQTKKPSSLQKAAKYPQKHRKVEIPFPNLRELGISDMTAWTSFQAAIESRLKNGSNSLKTIQLPKEDVTGTIMRHLTLWLPKQNIELALYEPGQFPISAPPVFQEEFCTEEIRLFYDIAEDDDWDDEEDDNYDYDHEFDPEYWEERLMDFPDYELPNDYFGFYGDEDDEEEDDEEEEHEIDEF